MRPPRGARVHEFSVVLGESRAGVALRDRAEFDIDLGLGGVVEHLVRVLVHAA